MEYSNQPQNVCDPAVGSIPKRAEQKTVGDYLDEKIAYARSEVERLCVAKAKAEALNILKWPHQQLHNIVAVF